MKKLTLKNISLEHAREICDNYALATTINLFIIDSGNQIIYRTRSKEIEKNNCGYDFCTYLNKCSANKNTCERIYSYGTKEAKRFGGRYIYFCHTGLAHFTSPVLIEDDVFLTIVSEPIIMFDSEEYFEMDLKKSLNQEQKEELKKLLKFVKPVEPSVVHALSEMLFVNTEYISKQASKEMDSYKMQGKISEFRYNFKEDEENHINSYFAKEDELMKAMQAFDKDRASELLNEILGEVFFLSGYRFEKIKLRVVELVSLLSRAAIKGGADIRIFGINDGYLEEIEKLKTIDETAVWLSKIMNRFMGAMFDFSDVQNKDLIYKALEYIRRNYMNKITLETVANEVYLSPGYFSKVFKQEMKINFSNYLSEYRIEKSKILISDKNLELTDISQMVGFEDQSYFTKVFKKTTGQSPGKYRRSMGI